MTSPNSSCSVAERNVRLLASRFDRLAASLEAHLRAKRRGDGADSAISISTLENGETVVSCRDSFGDHWLHPPPNPRETALRLWKDVSIPGQGLVILWNIGLGYSLQALLPFLLRKEFPTRAILCEENIELLWECLNRMECGPFLADPRVCLFFGAKCAEGLMGLLEQHPSLLLHDCILVPGRGLIPSEKETLAKITDRIRALKESASAPNPGLPNSRHWVIASNSLAEISRAFTQDAQTLGCTVAVVDRPEGLKNFFPNEKAWVETCGGVTPGYHIAAYSSKFSDAELRSMGNAGIRRVLWFLDRPSFVTRIPVDPECYDLALGLEPQHVDELRDMGFRKVNHLHFATGFSQWNPNDSRPPGDLGFPDVAYVGATGFRLYQPFLEQHLKETSVLMQEVRAAVNNRPAGRPDVLQSALTEIGSKYVSVWGTMAPRLPFQVATTEIRRMFLSAALPYGLRVYGDSLWRNPDLVGPVCSAYAGRSLDYTTETPHLYHRAKINLCLVNPALLESVPLRIFDTLACGGFLLTEYRPVFEELFEPGVHLDTFRDPKELSEKIEYYLSHEGERKKIAQAGREKVLAEHTFAPRIRQIMEWLEEKT
ncbi:MAG TPA: glycosyltransferase [bacterium]|nr:glycosyltransferase [bacterium]HQL61258.1 glycosyltransferase [bacterium]